MLPEKRRQGRAIRKRQRAVVRLVAAVSEVAMAIRKFGEVVHRIATMIFERLEPLVLPFLTYRRQYAYWLRQDRGALPPSGALAGDPSYSGGQALRSAPVASDDDDPFQGIGDY
jgi:hypothetical protein